MDSNRTCAVMGMLSTSGHPMLFFCRTLEIPARDQSSGGALGPAKQQISARTVPRAIPGRKEWSVPDCQGVLAPWKETSSIQVALSEPVATTLAPWEGSLPFLDKPFVHVNHLHDTLNCKLGQWKDNCRASSLSLAVGSLSLPGICRWTPFSTCQTRDPGPGQLDLKSFSGGHFLSDRASTRSCQRLARSQH